MCHKRRVWTRWVGVPLHAWSDRFFRVACSKFVSFIKLDHTSENLERLDVARVLLSVSFLKEINEVLQVGIRDAYSKLR